MVGRASSSTLVVYYIILIKTVIGLVDNEANVFCSNRIYEKESNMSTYELNSLCELIVNDGRFIIQLDPSVYIDKKLYQRDSKEFFLLKCKELSKSICYKGYGISLYNNNLKTLSVSLGEYSSNQIPSSKMGKIISKALNEATISAAIIRVIKEIERLVPIQSDDILPSYNDTDSNGNNGKNDKISPLAVLTVILIPFILIAILVFFVYKYHTMEINDTPPTIIHEYFRTLQIFQKEIASTKNKQITLNKCMLCLKIINPNMQKMFYEMEQIHPEDNLRIASFKKPSKAVPLLRQKSFDFSIDNQNTRYYCGHVYHNSCLLKIHKSQCLMCQDGEESIAIMNRSNQQTINENNLVCLLHNFNKIYSQTELNHYYLVFPNELEEAKDRHAKKNLFKSNMV